MASRTLPNLGLIGFFDLGEDGWDDEISSNLLKLSVLTQGNVISTVSATPGAPADGDVHIFDATHPTQANKVAVRDDGAWVYITPVEGWLLYDKATDKYMKFDGATWAELELGGGAAKYRVGFSIEGVAPAGSEIMLRHVFPNAVDFADDFAGSAGRHMGSNPATDQVFNVSHNGSAVGSITLSSAGAITFATTGGTLSVAAGDALVVAAPAGTPDANLVGLALTIFGVEAP